MYPASILILPGWTNSGPDHWQSHWERANPTYCRVQQDDWDRPDRRDWRRKINAGIEEAAPPIVLVAHSLGCVAAVDWAASAGLRSTARVAGALLVAPPDTERENAPEVLHSWRPMPLPGLPFPSILVASRTDDSASFARSQLFATAWGSSLIDAGDAGHIHTAAGFGPWREGHELLLQFIAQVVGHI
jgi:predicted alpha/beta hydrolase family esterase